MALCVLATMLLIVLMVPHCHAEDGWVFSRTTWFEVENNDLRTVSVFELNHCVRAPSSSRLQPLDLRFAI